MTRSAIRIPALELIAFGSESASGRWVACTRITPNARPSRMMSEDEFRRLLAVGLVGVQVLHLVEQHHDRVQAEVAPVRQLPRDLVVGTQLRGSLRDLLDDRGAPLDVR